MNKAGDRKVLLKLFLSYVFIYPLYYVFAMFVSVALLMWIYDWSLSFSLKIFYIFSAIMWFVCYVAHADILMFVLREYKAPSGKKNYSNKK